MKIIPLSIFLTKIGKINEILGINTKITEDQMIEKYKETFPIVKTAQNVKINIEKIDLQNFKIIKNQEPEEPKAIKMRLFFAVKTFKENKTFKCVLCDRCYKNRRFFFKHLKSNHNHTVDSYYCE